MALNCYTRPRKDGSKYTTCCEGKAKPKAKPKAKAKAKPKAPNVNRVARKLAKADNKPKKTKKCS